MRRMRAGEVGLVYFAMAVVLAGFVVVLAWWGASVRAQLGIGLLAVAAVARGAMLTARGRQGVHRGAKE